MKSIEEVKAVAVINGCANEREVRVFCLGYLAGLTDGVDSADKIVTEAFSKALPDQDSAQ